MRHTVLLASSLLFACPAFPRDAAEFAAWVRSEYAVRANITYKTASNVEQKLDVYAHRDRSTPRPTVIYIHGGGWVGGSKEGTILSLMPYLEMGFNAVNVGYRLGRVGGLPVRIAMGRTKR